MVTQKKRIICIGDVHGCLEELKELIETIDPVAKNDRVIFVGDLVDRGPDSPGVIRYIREKGFECVAGNHDNKFARFYQHEKKRQASLTLMANDPSQKPYKNPMRIRKDRRITYDSLADEDRQWLVGLPNFIHLTKHNLLVVHAGVQPGVDPLTQSGNVYRHCRYVNKDTGKLENLDTTTFAKPKNSELWADLYDGTLDIVYGHHVGDMEKPEVKLNKSGGKTIGIDTGCCFGGHLSAYVVDEPGGAHYFVQVKAKKVHYSRHSNN